MKKVTCKVKMTAYPSQIKVGEEYWLDTKTVNKDSHGEEFGMIYADEEKTQRIGMMRTCHF